MTHERACIRGCTVRDVHYATCAWFGMSEAQIEARQAEPDAPAPCRGCAPRIAREGSLVCHRCFGRMRRLLQEAPDMLGRMRSLADPTKAAVYSAVRAAGAPEENPAPVPSDLLDAISQITQNLRDWSMHVDPESWWSLGARSGVGPVRAYVDARTCADSIVGSLDRIVNDRDDVLRLAEAVLVRHDEQEDGGRAWSIADAMGRWGAERRTPDGDYAEDDLIELVEDVPEWEDRLVTIGDAARLASVTERTVQRWVKEGLIAVERRSPGPRGTITRWVYVSAVAAAQKTVDERAAKKAKVSA